MKPTANNGQFTAFSSILRYLTVNLIMFRNLYQNWFDKWIKLILFIVFKSFLTTFWLELFCAKVIIEHLTEQPPLFAVSIFYYSIKIDINHFGAISNGISLTYFTTISHFSQNETKPLLIYSIKITNFIEINFSFLIDFRADGQGLKLPLLFPSPRISHHSNNNIYIYRVLLIIKL